MTFYHLCFWLSFRTLVVVINFSQSTYSVNENDVSVQPELILSNPSVFDIILEIMDISIDLIGIINTYRSIDLLTTQLILFSLDEYISGPYEAIFLSGSIRYVVNITIVDDNLLEPAESFNLTIDSLSGDATIGDLDHTVISIIDNDGIYV